MQGITGRKGRIAGDSVCGFIVWGCPFSGHVSTPGGLPEGCGQTVGKRAGADGKAGGLSDKADGRRADRGTQNSRGWFAGRQTQKKGILSNLLHPHYQYNYSLQQALSVFSQQAAVESPFSQQAAVESHFPVQPPHSETTSVASASTTVSAGFEVLPPQLTMATAPRTMTKEKIFFIVSNV